MPKMLRSLVAVIAFIPFLSLAQASNPAEKADPGSILLNPSAIRIEGSFEILPGPTTLERAIRAIQQQIDQRSAEDAAQSSLEALWKNPVWRFLPADPGGTLNSPVGSLPDNLARNPLRWDDPFVTPVYLSLHSHRLDHELTLSDKRKRWFFGH